MDKAVIQFGGALGYPQLTVPKSVEVHQDAAAFQQAAFNIPEGEPLPWGEEDFEAQSFPMILCRGYSTRDCSPAELLRALLALGWLQSERDLVPAVKGFCQTWGPLNTGYSLSVRRSSFFEEEDFGDDGWHDWSSEWEPVRAYWQHSRRVRALLNVANDLHQGQPGKVEDWALYYGQQTQDMEHLMGRSIQSYKRRVAAEISFWIRKAAVHPAVRWDDQGAFLELNQCEVGDEMTTSYTTSQILALHLAAVITSPKGLCRCSICGGVYNPKTRKPREGENRYCTGSGLDSGLDCEKKGHSSIVARRQREKRQKAIPPQLT